MPLAETTADMHQDTGSCRRITLGSGPTASPTKTASSKRAVTAKGATVLEIDVTINPSSVEQAVRIAETAELLGGSQVGIWDSPALYTDPWVTLGVLSRSISRTPIGVTVTNPVTRLVVVTANAVASLSQVAQGGVYLGVGTGDSGVRNLHRSPSTRAELRSFIVTLKALLETGRARIDGRTYSMSVEPRGSIPIYLAAHGRRSIELGAELADGLLLGLGFSADVVEPVMNLISDVCGRNGRSPNDLRISWNSGGMYVDPTPGAAVDKAEWLMASFAHHFSKSNFEGKFVPHEYRAGIIGLGQAYQLHTHGSATESQVAHYREVAERLGVRDYLLDRYIIAGTSSEVSSRLAGLTELGVQRFSASVSTVDDLRPILGLRGLSRE